MAGKHAPAHKLHPHTPADITPCNPLSHTTYPLSRRLGIPGLPLPPPLYHQNAQQQHSQELQEVIRESKRVGELLLKAGDQELAVVQQQADTLLHKFRWVCQSWLCSSAYAGATCNAADLEPWPKNSAPRHFTG
jgi:hypothetical protein